MPTNEQGNQRFTAFSYNRGFHMENRVVQIHWARRLGFWGRNSNASV